MTSDAVEAVAKSGQATGPSPEGSEDARLAEQAAAAFQLLLKGIKNINIYRHAENKFSEFMEPAHKALGTFFEEEDVLPLKLSPYTLEFKKHVIYEDQNKENLTYKFYRDGMRYLMFRRGLPLEELVRFVLLAAENFSEAALFQEDSITRLWKEEFKCIEYVVMDGFGFGDMSEEEVEVEVEKIIGYLQKQLAASSKDVTRFARLSADDLALELNDIEQVRGGIISGRTSTAEDQAAIQQELFVEEKQRIFAKMVLILFQILQHDSTEDDFAMMADSFVQVLDTLLLTEDVRGSVALLGRLEKVAAQVADGPRADLLMRLRENFRRKMAEPQRLDAIGRYAALSRKLDEDAVRNYLTVCGDGELEQLADILAGMERPEGRRIFVQALSQLGKERPDVFARRLDNSASNVVRDMLTIILKIDPPDKLRMFARCLEHPNIMIRLEGLKIMAKAPENEAVRYLEQATRDEDMQMRLGAYRALAARSPNRASALLIRLLQSDEFAGLEQREKVAIATALGETRTKEALATFSGIFEAKASLFGRSKQTDLKMMALVGLTATGTVHAFKVLTRELGNRANSKEVLEAVQKAVQRLRTELGDQLEEGEA